MTQPTQFDTTQLQVLAAINSASAVSTATSDAATRAIWALWRQVNPYDKRALADFVRLAGQLLVSSQKSVATAHAAAQQVQLRALGINRPVLVTIPDNVRGATVTLGGNQPKVHPKAATVDYNDGGKQTIPKTDAEPGKVFERAAETYRYERSIGTDHTEANDKAEQRIAKIVDNNMILSARLAAQQTLVRVAEHDERIIGYRRVIHPELSKGGVCGMCVAAADRVYHVRELQPIHNRCKCTVSPVTTAHDPGFTLNQDDLDRLYSHAAEVAPMETVGGRERRALSTSAKALKKTRYRIVHHDELGPVLTRVPGHPVPYASTTLPAA
ncbi:VG15 protein [Mycobacterium colombiense]